MQVARRPANNMNRHARTPLLFIIVASSQLVFVPSALAGEEIVIEEEKTATTDEKTLTYEKTLEAEGETTIEGKTMLTTTTSPELSVPTYPVVTTEEVHILPPLNPLPLAHPGYGLPSAATQPATYQMAPPNVNYDPCPTPSPTTSWDRVFSKSGDFGNDYFGAGYWAGLTFSSRPGATPSSDSFTGEALFRAYVTVFSSDFELARIRGTAGLVGTQGSASYIVRVLGADVRSGSASGNLTGNPTYEATFLQKSSPTIWLGPLPVTFKGSVNGSVGVDYRAEYAMSTISLNAKPKARLYATATASVDAWLASAGVTGTVTLVQAELPSRADVVVGPTALAYGMKSSFVLTSLSGRIDAWAHVPGHTWRTELASWDPLFSGTYTITNLNSCQNPIVRPSCGNLVCETAENHDNCPSDCAAPPPPPPDPAPPAYCESKPWMCNEY